MTLGLGSAGIPHSLLVSPETMPLSLQHIRIFLATQLHTLVRHGCCRYHQPTTASTAQVLSSYAAAVNRQAVPLPQPVYQEEERVEPPESSSAVGATDFQLLRLAADDLEVQHSGMGLAELLRPAGSCPPCCFLRAYLLLTNFVTPYFTQYWAMLSCITSLVASCLSGQRLCCISSRTRLLVSIQSWLATSVCLVAGLH